MAFLLFFSSSVILMRGEPDEEEDEEDFFAGPEARFACTVLARSFSEASMRAWASRMASNSAKLGHCTLHNSHRRISSFTPS